MASYWNETSVSPAATFNTGGSAITLYQAHIAIQAPQGDFLQFFDAATTPSDGAQPLISVPVDEFINLGFGTYGRHFTSGIIVALSSTQFTYTHDGNGKMLCDLLCYSS